MQQFRHQPCQYTLRQQCVRDTNELGYTTFDPTHTCQDVAQHKIQQSLHRGQQQALG
jgi:hypothetical protein